MNISYEFLTLILFFFWEMSQSITNDFENKFKQSLFNKLNEKQGNELCNDINTLKNSISSILKDQFKQKIFFVYVSRTNIDISSSSYNADGESLVLPPYDKVQYYGKFIYPTKNNIFTIIIFIPYYLIEEFYNTK